MVKILYGKAIIDDMKLALITRADRLQREGVSPCLAALRVGERDDDIAYENSIAARAASVGVALRREYIPAGAQGENILAKIDELSSDTKVHGILVFRPLPQGADEVSVLSAIPAHKDVDGVTQAQMAELYAMKKYSDDESVLFFPCTAEAIIRMLDYYGITISGKRVVVIGRSTVVGKAVAHLLLSRDATVTICHSRTRDLAEMTREADIVVAAAGLAREGRIHRLGPEYFSRAQTIIDAAINADESGLYGDVNMDVLEAEKSAGKEERAAIKSVTEAMPGTSAVTAMTPVPGGLGGVTTLVLMEHVMRAAEGIIAI
jgi:methylenetetrahydrofolate dehydrogenase (NADP+)/methenyltetrahydrofolate cyclohydrolase